MRWLRLALMLAFAAATAACPPASEDATLDWGSARDVKQHFNLHLAGQPDAAGLTAAKKAGVSVVIDLRDPSEHDWDEATAARELGLAYHSVPVDGQELSRDAMQRIDAIVGENDDKGILIHCASGNRAAAWLAIHLAEQEGMDPAEALAIGRKAGLTKDALAANVTRYLEGSGS